MSVQTTLLREPASERLRLTLPWPPSVNDYKMPHPKLRGVYFLTSRAKKFREDVRWICLGARKFGAEPELVIDVMLHPPDKRKRDADNFGSKAIWDALQAAEIFEDDCQVHSFRVTKGAVVRGGAVVVEIWEREQC